MPLYEKGFHVEGSTGAILTKYWAGAFRAAYLPLTHFVIAAKSPTGVVLVVPEGGAMWSLPGGRVSDRESVAADAADKFTEESGLGARSTVVLGYFRILMRDDIEYGALVVCACDSVDAGRAKHPCAELRTWNCTGTLQGMDPISATLAIIAASSRTWQSEK